MRYDNTTSILLSKSEKHTYTQKCKIQRKSKEEHNRTTEISKITWEMKKQKRISENK